MQQRVLKMQDVKVRESEGARYLEGYFAVFNKPYQVCEDWIETIAPGAFGKFLMSGRSTKALWNHNHDIVLGNTTPGTLTLREDAIGLFGSILINEKDQDAKNAHARVERGDVEGCSIGFEIVRMEESWEGDQYRTMLLEIDPLYEVSPCTFPAYQDTSIHARAAQERSQAKERYEQKKQEKLEKWRAEMRARLKGE